MPLLLTALGIDSDWSVGLARRWCHDPTWVHPNTNLMAAFVRDAAALLGNDGKTSFEVECGCWLSTLKYEAHAYL